MTKEDISFAKLNQRITISKHHKQLDTLIDAINNSKHLDSIFWWKPSYMIFRRNEQLIIRLYSPGTVRVRALMEAFKTADLLGYIDNLSPTQEYVEFSIYFKRW